MENKVVPDPPVIGIDLGGTKISTALVDSRGNIIAHDYRETYATREQEVVVERITANWSPRLLARET